MIKQMERRFTIVAISVISLVLLFLVLGVQGINSQLNIRKADIILRTISEEQSDIFLNRGTGMGSVDMTSIRSFSVVIAEDGTAQVYITSGVDLIEETVALSMAMQVKDAEKVNGFIDGHRYLVIEDDGEVSVYFLDYSFEEDAARNLLWVSLAVYAVFIVMVTVLVKVFMKFVMKPIKESYERQKQFITDASHELKTPLTVIATDMQLIEMESGSTKWTKSVNKQVERLSALSNDLVVLSRMDEKANNLNIRSLNLSDLVNDVVYGFEPALIASGKELVLEVLDELRISGDYDAVEKVMTILMENALKYSSKDGQVLVRLVKNNKGCVLSVENSVDAIEVGSHNEYFERFYRADKSRNSQTGGFGIGLAVVKSIVEQHRWKIEAYSREKDWIAFTIEL